MEVEFVSGFFRMDEGFFAVARMVEEGELGEGSEEGRESRVRRPDREAKLKECIPERSKITTMDVNMFLST